MSKINQPYDFLELDELSILKTVLQENFALEKNEYRPLQQFDKAMRIFARDFLRNYLLLKPDKSWSWTESDLENAINKFELEIYGTQNKSNENIGT